MTGAAMAAHALAHLTWFVGTIYATIPLFWLMVHTSGICSMLLACTVSSGEVVLYGLTAFALLTGWLMIQQEEAELERCFGDKYRAYKRAVPRLMPRVPRLSKTRQR
jgi:protein-S-isoprenylcysteine O-methyltransferase Ste14